MRAMPRGDAKRGWAQSERVGTPHDAFFSEGARNRGHGYFASGLVRDLTRDRQRYRARVVGTSTYAVELVVPEPGESAQAFEHDCDCPARARYGECKHEYAVLLATLATLGHASAAERAHDDEPIEQPTGNVLDEPIEGLTENPIVESDGDRWSAASDELAPSASARASAHASQRLRELHSLMDFAARSGSDDAPPASPHELGLRLETPTGFDLERLHLRPVVSSPSDSSPDPRHEPVRVEGVEANPVAFSDGTWRPFEPSDVSRLSAASERLLDVLDRTVITEPVWGRTRRWSAGLEDVLLIDDDALHAIAALFGERRRLRAPTPEADASGFSPALVVEREPFVFGLRQLSDARGRRLEGVLVRDGVERVPRLDTAGDRVLLRPLAAVGGDTSVVLASFGWALLDGHRLVPIATEGATEVWKRLVLKGGIELAETPEVREALVGLAESAGTRLEGVDLPPLSTSAPHPILRVDAPRPSCAAGKLPCSIAFSYGGREVTRGDVTTRVLVTESARHERDRAAERARVGEAFDNGLKPLSDPAEDEGDDGWIVRRELGPVVQRLIELGWMVEAEGHLFRSHTKSTARVATGLDWFGVSGTVRFDGVEIPLPDVLRAARKGESWIELGDGSRGVLPKDWLERWEWLELGRENADGTLHFRREQGWLIDALLAARGPVDSDAEFRRFIERLEGFERIEPKAPPASFKGELRAYQREGLGWFAHLERLGVGGCLADDMGLGKTVQVLAWLEARRKRRPPKGAERRPSLVVVPRSLLFNWKDEAARFTPQMRVALHHGPKRKRSIDQTFAADLVVTTYGTLRSDVALFEDQAFDAVVLDEAQAIKNERSQASKAVRLLEARQRVALSGTPIENGIDELWALFEFLNPGMLGTVPAFKRLLTGRSFDGQKAAGGRSEAVSRADSEARSEADATVDVEADVEAAAKAHADEARHARIRAIGRAIRPFFLRRTKAEVLTDLPEKTEQIVQVELPPKQRKTYDEAAAFFRAQLLGAEATDGGEPMDAMSALTALLRLRQLACHPGLVDPQRGLEPSGKLDELIPMLMELVSEGHKAVVFSQFTSLLDLVAQRLDHAELGFETLTGATRDRKRCVERFQTDPEFPIFLVSLKAGGVGLNLTAADFVFLLDPWWNPAAEAQAIDRAHRIGRTRPVHAYRFVARNTIEARVLELQDQKRQLAAQLLDGAASRASDVTRENLRALLEG